MLYPDGHGAVGGSRREREGDQIDREGDRGSGNTAKNVYDFISGFKYSAVCVQCYFTIIIII